MVLNEPVSDFHDFHDLDLIPVRSLAWIFPDQQTLTVGKPFVRSMPAHQCIWHTARTFLKERTNLAVSAKYAAAAVVEDRLYQRGFQHCLLRIKSQQTFGIARFRAFVPLLMNALAVV